MFCAQGAHDKYYRHDRMDWLTNSMPPTKKWDPNECRIFIQNLSSTDSTEVNKVSYNGSLTLFDRLSFRVRIESKQTPFNVTKKTVYILVYSPMNLKNMIGLLVLKNQSQDVKMIKNMLLTKIVGQ